MYRPFALVLTLFLVWSPSNVIAQENEAPEYTPGEKLDPALYGAAVIESMQDVIARDQANMTVTATVAEGEGHRGIWVVPSRRATYFPYSGQHNLVNKWGDTRMGIDFPEVVDVRGAYFTGQAADGAWTTGVRVIGYRGKKEVKTTAWFDELSSTPTWFEIDLQGVDRIVIQATPRIDGAGWYALDDLTYVRSAQAGGKESDVVVLDFEDCSYGQQLTGSHYAGLTWEAGAGDFESDNGVPAPQAIPYEEDENASAEPQGGSSLRGLGTLPNLDLSFQGTIRGDPGTTIPPDTCGAVGPNHFVETINRNFSVFLKATGQRVMNTTLGSFLPGSNGDPRILFDQYSNRWIVTVPDFNTRVYLAVSLTDDPTGSWFKTNFTVAQGSDSGCWPDYPTLGLDDEGIYVATYMVGCGMSIFAIDKAPLISGSPSLGTITAWRGLSLDGAIQPVHTFGNPGGEYLVSRASSNALRVRRVLGPLTSPTLQTLSNVAIPSHSFPPDAPSLGSSTALDVVDHRLMNAVYRNGSIWTAHAVGINGRSACRWYEVGVSPLQLDQSGTISDPSLDRKSTRLNSSHTDISRMPSSA